MRKYSAFINEKLLLGKNHKNNITYNYKPTSKKELRNIIIDRINVVGPDCNLNDIDVSQITDMSYLFWGLEIENIDISCWNVSNVTNMEGMFNKCKNFNSDISEWNVSNVKNFNYMFYMCKKFKADLSEWNINKNASHSTMFFGCLKQNKNERPKGLQSS